GWKVFFNMLGLMYHNHPVKLEIAGTVESISHITSDLLYKCYNTFYNLSNMSLIVIADIDPEKTLEVINSSILKSEPKDKITHIYPDEPDTVAGTYAEASLSVSMPLFMMGFKDIDVGYGGDRLLKKNIITSILLEMIFGKSGKLYNDLYESGLITDSLEYEYTMQKEYAYTAIEAESKDPGKVYEEILSHIEYLRKNGLSEESFERIKKVVWGDYIRSFNDVEGYAHGFMTLLFTDIDYTHYFDVYKTITFEDVKKRFDEHFVRERSVLSVVKPV
ncbi:MAG: insulinase family protein, partial [Oscillospiraceae bacterium]|nr:insulinase family protein [Oscillospiraceae bacterium]